MTVRHATRSGRVLRCLAAVGLLAGATVAGSVALPGSAHADSEFASVSDATIHPGVSVESPAGQCTANFIYTSGSGDNKKIYIGQAAHCTGEGQATDTNGCKAKSTPLGTEIVIDGASNPGKLVYNSWLTMQERGESDPSTCEFNDFALVEIDSEDESKVNPTVPSFGGPNGLRSNGLAAGELVYSFGNSGLRQGLEPLSPKQGINLGDSGNGWTHMVATLTPGVPGDSGSGFLDSDGRAFGVLSTLNLAPAPGTNGVSDLHKLLSYANEHGDLGRLSLADGSEKFHGGPLPIPALGSSPSEAGSGSDSDPGDGASASDASPSKPVAVNPKNDEPASADQSGTPALESDSGADAAGSDSNSSEQQDKTSDGGLLGGL